MGIFEERFGKNEEDLSAERKAQVKKRLERGFASASDSMVDANLDLEEELDSMKTDIANGNVSAITDLAIKLVEQKFNDEVKEMIDSLKDEFFAK